MSPLPLHRAVLDWYAEAQRDLPWRRPECSPWGVFVSEVMLQQTPVVRVLPVWQEWMHRWPTPAALAAEPSGEAVRAWGRLGYPRRALRLHAAATAMAERHGGDVPASVVDLQALPGVGVYTAAAVAAFAFGDRVAVVDTNVRRVHARAVSGVEHAAPALTRAESDLAAELLPEDPDVARVWNVAVMELGALVCTARGPRCDDCPVLTTCAWVAAGRPAYDGPPRRGQAWAGTDRQVRGRLLQVLRESDTPVPAARLEQVWDQEIQRERCLDGLVSDGLVEPLADGTYRLPGG
ncbi:A/G-specific adenine glycosylase [Luteipulveratus sp. YIM 133296]|uniref:Adenine DNA glycosylase n=1 Tax=Luteipulveratus flavus TaxID=3031728 RepID=A0ABT6C8P4_9MICO|nr:A/G-specific adenine glycosylase [Luteipulveratus sp. YIM 133296]MDF8264692.1 A/G-specific adenine glycosylase [Luteipulveratus sp. YIM 133296]